MILALCPDKVTFLTNKLHWSRRICFWTL